MESVRETINNIMQQYGFRHKHQVARYFGVSPQALSIWIAKDQIPPKHLLKLSRENIMEKSKQVDNIAFTPGSKKELQSIINYLMRENIELKDKLAALKKDANNKRISGSKGAIFDRVMTDSLYISGRVTDGVITELDGRWMDVMGYEESQLKGKSYDSDDLIHPDDLEHVRKIQDTLKGSTIISLTRYSTIQRWKHGKTKEYIMLSMVWDVDVEGDTALVVCKPIDGFITV